ncbi:MAG: helix-turn-helix transcriptional regulator [Lachnospiraceae bacterium]
MGVKLKEVREKAGISQEELSRRSKVSRSIISGLESGRTSVTTTSTLIKIANGLGIKVGDIFFD